MTTHEAYEYQANRLTSEEKIQLNMKEGNIGRKLLPWEIVTIFKLEPSGDMKPKKQRRSDEVENDSWINE